MKLLEHLDRFSVAALLGISLLWQVAARGEVPPDPPVLAVIDFFPFGYLDENGQPAGMAFDVVREVQALSGVKIDARLMSVPRALRSASVGQNDMLFSYKDALMVPNVTWLGNVGCLLPLVVPNRTSGIHTLDDLHGKRVGFVGLGYFDVRMKTRWRITPVMANDNFLMLRMLVRGRLDAIIINNGVLNALLADPRRVSGLPDDWNQLLGPPLPLDIFETHLSLSNSSVHQPLIPRLRQAVAQAKAEGRFARIFRHYGSRHGGHCFNQEEIESRLWLNPLL